MTKIFLYYDSQCPLCVAEMRHLKAFDQNHSVELIDLNDPDFCTKNPEINRDLANEILHARLPSGEIILGLDATVAVWRAVEKYHWIKIIRWPVISIFADGVYRVFAKHRYFFSYILTGKKRCEPCRINPAKNNSSYP